MCVHTHVKEHWHSHSWIGICFQVHHVYINTYNTTHTYRREGERVREYGKKDAGGRDRTGDLSRRLSLACMGPMFNPQDCKKWGWGGSGYGLVILKTLSAPFLLGLMIMVTQWHIYFSIKGQKKMLFVTPQSCGSSPLETCSRWMFASKVFLWHVV